MAEPVGVSDEVWSQLDPGAGRPTRRSRRLTIGVAAIVALLIVCWYLAGITGLTMPRLHTGSAWSTSFSTAEHTVDQTFTVTNDSWLAQPVAGVASPTDDLRITGVDGLPPAVRSGEQITIVVHMEVTRCAAFVGRPSLRPEPPALRLRVSRWWGTMSIPTVPIPDTALESSCS